MDPLVDKELTVWSQSVGCSQWLDVVVLSGQYWDQHCFKSFGTR